MAPVGLAVVWIIAAAALAMRCMIAGDVFAGDEAFGLSTALRYVSGDRPLIDSWDTNFSSAIMAMPFVRAFLAARGSTDGIFLAWRGVYFVLALATSVLTYVALKDRIDRFSAVMSSVLIMLFLPFLSPHVGYGADWLWHIMSALVAVILWQHPPRRAIVNVVPGVLSALGIIGNPPTILVVPFFAAALWIAHRDSHEKALSAILMYLAGGAVVLAAFAAAVLLLSGPRVLSLFRYVASPDDHDFRLVTLLARLRSARTALLIILVLGLVFGLIARAVPRNRLHALASAAFAASVLAALLAFFAGRIWVPVAPQLLTSVSAAPVLMACIVAGRARIGGDWALLVLPAVGTGVGWLLTSNAGLAAAMLASPLLLMAALLTWRDEQPRGPLDAYARAASLARLIALPAIVLTVAAISVAGYGALRNNVAISQGPFRGMYARADQARRYDRVLDDLRSLPPTKGRTVFLERFPLGYVLDGVRPGTYSTWATSSSSDRLQTYIDATGNEPQRIVLTRFRANLNDGEFVNDD